MGVAGHISSVTQRAMGKVMKVVTMFHSKKVHCEVLWRIYKRVYVVVVAYAAGSWAVGLTEQLKGKLNSEQRKMLKALTRAYRME